MFLFLQVFLFYVFILQYRSPKRKYFIRFIIETL